MAQDWCIAYGILSTAEAEKLYKDILKRQAKSALSPSSSSSKKEFEAKSKGKGSGKKGKRAAAVKEEVDDVGMDVGGGGEGASGVAL